MLAAAGAEDWYGIDLSEEKKALENDRSFNAGLASLYRRQAVEWTDGLARITGPYRAVFRTLRDAKVCIVMRTAAAPGRAELCYCSRGMAAVVSKSEFSDSEIGVLLLPVADWLKDIGAGGALPVSVEGPEGTGMPAGSDGRECCSFELRKVSDGTLLESMAVYERGLYAEIRRSGSRNAAEVYRRERVLEILAGWSGGAE